jgi:hypothetical protein
LVIGRNFEPVDPEITLDADTESTLWLDFDDGVQSNDWFVLTLQFDNGESGQYFISLRDETDETGGDSIRNPSVSDINDTSDEEQNITFEVARDYSADEEVTIDLSDATGGQNIDYKSASIDSTSKGSASFDNNGKGITYTSDGNESEGDTITIEFSGVDASGVQDSYSVEFTGPDGDTVSDTFSVN